MPVRLWLMNEGPLPRNRVRHILNERVLKLERKAYQDRITRLVMESRH